MADAVAPAAPAAGENAAPEQVFLLWNRFHTDFSIQGRSWTSIVFGVVKQMMMFYFISSMMKGFGGGGGNNANSTAPANVQKYPPAHNLFAPGELFDLFIYLDESVCVNFHGV